MRIRYQAFPEKQEYQSLLVINEAARWREALYFTFNTPTPWGDGEEGIHAGRAMADFHLKNNPCLCVLAFDFHLWDGKTIGEAMDLELPPLAFDRPLAELLERSLQEREAKPDGFAFSVK